jgi:multiple sugar transport system permease protein
MHKTKDAVMAPSQQIKSTSTRFKPTSETLFGYFLILPTLILIGIIIVYPVIDAVLLSFTNRTFINPNPDFIGLANYERILTSPAFRDIVFNSFVWTVCVVGFQFLVGLAVALLLNQYFIGRGLARALIVLPWVTPGVIAALLWRLLYEPQLGMLNGILATLGVANPTIPWLSQGSTAMVSVIIAAVWKGAPFSVVMYLAALQSVSDDLMDAAKVDGASFWARLRHVILPEITPIIRVTLLLTTVLTFNYFDLIYVMTDGGPLRSTHIFPTWIYQQAFGQSRTALAAAYGILSVLILLVFSLFYIREMNKRKALD